MTALARRLASTTLLIAAALAVQQSATLSWGGAWAPDGTRYKLSPVGLSHVLRPAQGTSPTVSCRWISQTGDEAPCAVRPGGEGAFTRLKLAYPALLAASWIALAGVLANAFPWSRRDILRSALAATAALAALAAIGLVVTAAPRALAALASLRVTYGSLGFLLACAAPALLVASCFLRTVERPVASAGSSRTT
jgi:hypothetical protein